MPEGNKPEWSGGQRGLHLYLQRLLQPTWDDKLVSAASKANPNSLMPNLSQDTLQVGGSAAVKHHSCRHLLLVLTVVWSERVVVVESSETGIVVPLAWRPPSKMLLFVHTFHVVHVLFTSGKISPQSVLLPVDRSAAPCVVSCP